MLVTRPMADPPRASLLSHFLLDAAAAEADADAGDDDDFLKVLGMLVTPSE